MNLIQTILSFLVVLGTLVVVHELGHYLVARWCGVKVLRFSVGMGKVVYSRRIGPDQTEWALSILPLGGYVKMLDARDAEQGELDKLTPAEQAREFTRQSVWKRIAIVAAGPVANFLLAIVIFSGLFMVGIPEPKPLLRVTAEHTVARQSGLEGGELVTAVNGEPVRIWSEFRWQLLQLAMSGRAARLDVERDDAYGKRIDTLTLPLDSLKATDLEQDFMGQLGLELARPSAVLGRVSPGGAADRAGLKEGDRILEIDDVPVTDALALVTTVRASPGRLLSLHGLRDGEEFDAAVTPEADTASGNAVGRIQVGLLLTPAMTITTDGPVTALHKGALRTWDTSLLTIKMIGKMIAGDVSIKNLTGPITIADYAGQTARAGLISFMSFMALISISLGVMNLLPIPVLDGGLLLYYSLEVLTGRPISERFGDIAQRAGAGILMTLMCVAVFNDLTRLFS